MPGITTRITFWIMCFLYVTALMQNLGVLPANSVAMDTMQGLDTTGQFTEVAKPNAYQNDPMSLLSGLAFVVPALEAFVLSLGNMVYVIPIITNWGFDIQYALVAQGLILGLYIYDLIALWRGWEPL